MSDPLVPPPWSVHVSSLHPSVPSLPSDHLAAVLSAPLQLQSFAGAFGHVNAEQRARCDRVQKLHHLSHVSDDVLCQA